jgi:hypothetical protein
MIARVDNTAMFLAIFFVGVVALCVLGAVYGADSRHDETVSHRRSLL